MRNVIRVVATTVHSVLRRRESSTWIGSVLFGLTLTIFDKYMVHHSDSIAPDSSIEGEYLELLLPLDKHIQESAFKSTSSAWSMPIR